MGKYLELAIGGFFTAVVAVIIFVRAGQKGGRSGGQQTADIITASGQAINNVATGLEG
jgi:hypothetical protein